MISQLQEYSHIVLSVFNGIRVSAYILVSTRKNYYTHSLEKTTM